VKIDPDSLNRENRYFLMTSCIVPRPVALVGTVNEDGSPNLAPYSYFNGVSPTPPIFCLGIGPSQEKPEKDTLRNLRRTGELTVSIPKLEQVEQVEATGAELAYGEDEFKHCGLKAVPGEVVAPCWAAGSAAAFECVVDKIIPVGDCGSTLVLAEIKLFHIPDELLDQRMCLDPGRFTPLARLSGGRYAPVGAAFKPVGEPSKEEDGFCLDTGLD